MLRFLRRLTRQHDAEPTPVVPPPPPTNPVELGLALRAARERLGVTLEDAAERTGVPTVDMTALEDGDLERLHVEQAGVVALWRYAGVVGLPPEPLVAVLRANWPNRALAVDAFVRTAAEGAMPLASLFAAETILAPILQPRGLMSGQSTGIGLSSATLESLRSSSIKGSLRVVIGGPAKRRSRTSPAKRASRSGGAAKPRSRGAVKVPSKKATVAIPTTDPEPEPEAVTSAALLPHVDPALADPLGSGNGDSAPTDGATPNE